MSEHRASAVEAWERLFRAQVSVMRDLRLDFTGTGMTMNEYDVLFNIARQPDRRIRLRDLNLAVLITQSSVSRLVDRLISRGLVAKDADPLDARGATVRLTPEGMTRFAAAAKVHMQSIEERLEVLDADELDALARICAKLVDGDESGDGADRMELRGA